MDGVNLKDENQQLSVDLLRKNEIISDKES